MLTLGQVLPWTVSLNGVTSAFKMCRWNKGSQEKWGSSFLYVLQPMWSPQSIHWMSAPRTKSSDSACLLSAGFYPKPEQGERKKNKIKGFQVKPARVIHLLHLLHSSVCLLEWGISYSNQLVKQSGFRLHRRITAGVSDPLKSEKSDYDTWLSLYTGRVAGKCKHLNAAGLLVLSINVNFY